MIDLNEKVFGNIESQQILGSEPVLDELKVLLEDELDILTKNLESLEKTELVRLKEKQKELEKEVNMRPGAMALPQEKIRLYVKFSCDYIQKIEEQIDQNQS